MATLSRPQFGTDGVRGTFGQNLTTEFVYCLGQAIAKVLGTDRNFLVGRDTRMSGPVLQQALQDGLLAAGAKVIDVGILTTPGIATIARRDSLPACVLTASHNPADDNGVKVFGVGGVKIKENLESEIENELEILLSNNPQYDEHELTTQPDTQASKEYVSYLLDSLDGASLSGLKVVLDCANGAAYGAAPSSFLLAGAQVVAINTECDGVHINENCGATHLAQLKKEVLSHKADIGFAFDGDADRLIVVDDRGNIRDGDAILALFAIEMASKNMLSKNTVVATSMSNGGLRKFLETNGMQLVETQVGDKFVLEEMLNNNFSLGGEQSGHIIRTDFSNWGDGILNALQISKIYIDLLNLGPKVSSSQMFSLFVPLVQLHDKVKVTQKSLAERSQIIQDAIAKEKSILGEGSKIIIRPSGTEEVVRITVEGLIEEQVKESVSRLAATVEKVCG